MNAWLNLRYTIPQRQEAFKKGLEKLGYEVFFGHTYFPGPKDIFVTWNRIGVGDSVAKTFIAAGRPVLVTENASWGNSFADDNWYTIARNYHNRSDCFPVGDNARWDDLNVELQPWRAEGETIILPQRGIGPDGIAMPRGWGQTFQGRIRRHPGRNESRVISLEDDLAKASKVITWGSGAAIKALLWGIRVESYMPLWIGEQDNTDAGRLAMFRRLAWAQWRLSEIQNGEPFAWLLNWNTSS